MSQTQDLYKKAKNIIPGGTQLLSKRPEMFLPDHWPAYYDRAKGCEVWDLDGNRYLDMSYMGIGSCTLGYADEDVNAAVIDAVSRGSMCTLNAPEEVALAELLLELHPWAGMVRFSRTGGEAMSIAVRIARARTQKDVVLFCGYHGWHDWYISSNIADDKSLDGHLLPGLSPLGVPRALNGTSYPFAYNDTGSFLRLAEQHRGKIGAIIMESVRNDYPDKDFVDTIRRVATEQGIVFIVDEITAGWRQNVGGAHLLLGMQPDIAVFAKGMSNGVPMAAIVGKGDIMKTAQDTFISSTYWTERAGPAAALATIRKLRSLDVPSHLVNTGRAVKEGWRSCAEKHGISLDIGGTDPLGHFGFRHDDPFACKTLFTQLMLDRGFLATTAFYASYAHKAEHVQAYIKATDESFAIIARAIRENNVAGLLKGPVCHKGFKRLT